MKKHLVLSMVLILLCLFSGCVQATQPPPEPNKIKYTMYIGLNDKDTYTQLIPTADAQKKIEGIALKHVDGFSSHVITGAYKDDEGVTTRENSLVFEFYDADEQQMKAIMDEVLAELNQNSILLEKHDIDYEFYEGNQP